MVAVSELASEALMRNQRFQSKYGRCCPDAARLTVAHRPLKSRNEQKALTKREESWPGCRCMSYTSLLPPSGRAEEFIAMLIHANNGSSLKKALHIKD